MSNVHADFLNQVLATDFGTLLGLLGVLCISLGSFTFAVSQHRKSISLLGVAVAFLGVGTPLMVYSPHQVHYDEAIGVLFVWFIVCSIVSEVFLRLRRRTD